jgi:hypothetical protein
MDDLPRSSVFHRKTPPLTAGVISVVIIRSTFRKYPVVACRFRQSQVGIPTVETNIQGVGRQDGELAYVIRRAFNECQAVLELPNVLRTHRVTGSRTAR